MTTCERISKSNFDMFCTNGLAFENIKILEKGKLLSRQQKLAHPICVKFGVKLLSSHKTLDKPSTAQKRKNGHFLT
jgi:hypothetical protein